MNPDHLLDQALSLAMASPAGAPRQADLRRAISASYYALFHFALTAATDLVLGRSARRKTPNLYVRAYRTVEHSELRKRSNEIRNSGASTGIVDFADAIVELQEARHRADYDPLFRIKRSEAVNKVFTAVVAIAGFKRTSDIEKKSCLVTLLFKGR
jgi:hypothetical protein